MRRLTQKAQGFSYSSFSPPRRYRRFGRAKPLYCKNLTSKLLPLRVDRTPESCRARRECPENRKKAEKEDHDIMNQGISRSIFRWIHIVFAIPIIGYIYSPFEKIPNYAPATRFVFLPVMVLTGLWMWKGHVLRRLISKRPALQNEGSERT
jgi:hypothetical protein